MKNKKSDFSKYAYLDIYRKKRVFITGDTGFKGAWLSFWLKELGADIVGYALPERLNSDLFNVLNLEKSIQHIDGDIRDYAGLEKIIDNFHPEFIFHLAAQAIVRLSYDEPKGTFDTNILGSVNMLEIARKSSYLKALIYVTSDKCYKNKELMRGYRENDELGGYDPYSASKAAAEIVMTAYQNSFFKNKNKLGVASVRAGNVIGGGDWSENRIVPDCIRSLSKNKPVLIRNPKSVRPWQYVLEPLYGYLVLAAKLFKNPKQYSGAYNFGPLNRSMKTVEELAMLVIKCWGDGEIKYEKNSTDFYESTMLHLNCDKARQVLAWSQQWDFDKTVFKTVQWYKHVLTQKPAISITRQQINDYMGGDYD